MTERDAASAPAADPLVGARLGKDYDVVAELGRGGMGVVYLVEHIHLRKRFAAKVLSAELAASADARMRFQTEAHAASQLAHDNIVSITDYGISMDGRPYLVMELLRGETLEQRLSLGPLSLEERVAVLVPTCHALAEAHAEGIVHRDVKPENIFLTQRSGGRFGVKVLDFGIAKTPTANARLTKLGQALGSPMYMAPEMCRGDEIDHRADVYAVGVLMYLLWCGRVPFEDENYLKVMHLQANEVVPPPREVQPGIAPAIEAVILRALAKDPDARYLSIAALLAALEAALPVGADALLVASARGTTTMAMPTAALSGERTGLSMPTTDALEHGAVHAQTVPPRARRSRVVVVALVLVVLLVAGAGFALTRDDGTGGRAAAPSSAPTIAPAAAAAPMAPTGNAPIAPAVIAPLPPVVDGGTDAAQPEEEPAADAGAPRTRSSRGRTPRATPPPVTPPPVTPPVRRGDNDLDIRTSR